MPEKVILGSNATPDASGDVFQQWYDVIDTLAVIAPMIWVFNNSGNRDGLRGLFRIPDDYGDAAKIRVYWTANSSDSTNGVILDLAHLARAAGEDMGAAATDDTDTITDTHTGTPFQLNIAEIDVTDADFTAGDLDLFELFRSSDLDVFAAAVIVFIVTFKYDAA